MSDSPIESDPDIFGGAPVFSGTRVPLRIPIDAFLDDFPTVSRDRAVAVLERVKAMLAGEAPQKPV